MGKRILIGISVYNEHRHLEMLLQSIRWYTYYDESEYDIVVCDDGSQPHNLETIRAVCANFGAVLIENQQNLGIPRTWNHLCEALGAKSEIIVLLNDDIIVPPNWLRIADHFLTANKYNPTVGTMFWNPYNNFTMDMMKAILPSLGHTIFKSADHLSGSENWFDHAQNCSPSVVETTQGTGEGLGRCMCPCGCCFAFRREMYDRVCDFNARTYGFTQGFDPRIKSFHEESQFGTVCAYLGAAAWGFAYPRPYHRHGQTFSVSPELQADMRMRESRALYRGWWNVPTSVQDYFGYVNERLMPLIPPTPLKFLTPDYTQPPDEYTHVGGEIVRMPKLVEVEREYADGRQPVGW